MKHKKPPRSALEIIGRIKSGQVDPCTLSPEARQRCVEYLLLEGVTMVEIAQILKCSERTVGRDRSDIRQRHAIERDPALGGIMAGALLSEAENAVSRIRRCVRATDVAASDKIAGERACFEIFEKATARLQSMGYLPQASTRIEADVRVGPSISLDEIRAETERLRKINSEGKPKRKKVTSRSRPASAFKKPSGWKDHS